ncbi:MAG: Diaminopimelate epimerase [Methanonatronarchaeales archaeon]|nr:Diaminopimelate epimerase [Methanonatronarchaeales archaeon]
MEPLPFTKLHGNGNDFILIDEYEETLVFEEDRPDFARAACHRHFGVGGDGALFLSRGNGKLRMRIFNADGSEPEMCGNGIRCFLRYAVERGYASLGEVEVSTEAGDLVAEVRERDGEAWVEVDMGEPTLLCSDIPAAGESEFREEIGGFEVYACNTGVPHAVVFVDDVDDIDVEEVAPRIRFHGAFPEGANVNFVEVTDDALRVRTYERGVEGETLSCGTGATAVAVIANTLERVGEEVDVETRGGPLKIHVGETVRMAGPAVEVFTGTLDRDSLPPGRPP